VGNSKADSVYVIDMGGSALTVSSVVSDNPAYTVDPGSAPPIASLDSTKFKITFTPTFDGVASGNIVFTHDASGSPDTVAVTGIGLVPQTILSNGKGAWASTTTWQGGLVPRSVDSVVIRSIDSVFVLADAACRGLNVLANGTVVLSDTLSIVDGTVSGTVAATGVANASALIPSDSVNFESGGKYQHALPNGTIPFGRWSAGSTCAVTGYTGGSKPEHLSQNFYHFIWDCEGQTGSQDLSWFNNTIGGNVTFGHTNNQRIRLTSPTAGSPNTITINGDITSILGALVESNGSSNPATITIHTYGNINVNGGNFSVSRGSGTTVRWHVYGDFSMSGATTQASGDSRFVFSKAGTENLTLSSVTFGGGGFPIEVSGGTTLNAGASVISGSGVVIVNAGATFGCGHPDGLNGTLAGGGTKTLSTEANYTFNGSAPQVTGSLLPVTVNDLTLDNPSGITLSSPITVNGILSLPNGDLNLNGNNVTLGPSGLLSETPGNTVTGTSGVVTTTRTLTAPSGSTNIAGLGIMIGSAADLGSTLISRGHAVQSSCGSIQRYFNIAPTTNSGLNATFVFKYDESELGGATETTLGLLKSTDAGASWNAQGGTVNTTDNTITLSGVDEFSRWTAAGTSSVNVGVLLGWSLQCNPVTRSELPQPTDSVLQLYPTSVSAYGFAYVAGSGYIQRYRMPNRQGFWIKSSGAVTQPITGYYRGSDAIPVVTGWNLVGGISCIVDTGTITPQGLRSSNWWGYSPTGYFAATQIVPGKAYWIKANANSAFIMSCPTMLASKAEAVRPAEEEFNSIKITDAEGNSQTLLFGTDAKDQVPISMYEMPPAPPEGSFDARFETEQGGFMLQTHAEAMTAPVEFAIAVQASAYPLKITWKIAGAQAPKPSYSYELSDGLGGQAFGTQTMSGEGTMTISKQGVARFVLIVKSGEQLPTEYALYQNYPNPFNPTTNIKFALPVLSRVMVEIYNIVGQRVRTLVNEERPAGYHVAEWSGTGDRGLQLGSGVYFVRIDAKGDNGATFSQVRKLMMLK